MKKITRRAMAVLLAVVVFFNTMLYSSVNVYAVEEIVISETVKAAIKWIGKTVAGYYIGKGLDWIWAQFTSQTDIDENGEIIFTEEQVELLASIIEEYALSHPEDVERVEYNLFRTSTFEEMWDLETIRKVSPSIDEISPSSLDTLENFREIFSTQSEFTAFPTLLYPNIYYNTLDPVKNVGGGYVNQNLTFFKGFEKALSDSNKASVFVGSYNADGTYRISIYIYDYTEKTLTLDRMQSMNQQYRFIPLTSDGEEIDFNVTPSAMTSGYKVVSSGKYSYSSEGDANIYCDYSYNGILGRLPHDSATGEISGYAQSLMAIHSQDYFTTTLPLLATPDGRSYKLFATQDDALAYMRTESRPGSGGLNYDPSLGYTGGSVTINNNGDVTINNDPSGGGDFPETDNEMLKAIYDRLGEILTQVKQIKWIAVVDTVIDGLDLILGDGGIAGGLAALADAVSQVFPLCILWDVVRLVEIFEADPSPPVFTIPIKFGAAGLDTEITLDLSEYETIFAILRVGEILLFMVGLFNITMTWVGKGDDVI